MTNAGTTYAKVCLVICRSNYYYCWYLARRCNCVTIRQSFTLHILYVTSLTDSPQTPDPLARSPSLSSSAPSSIAVPPALFCLAPRSPLVSPRARPRSVPPPPSPPPWLVAPIAPLRLLSKVARPPPRLVLRPLVLRPLVPRLPCGGELYDAV